MKKFVFIILLFTTFQSFGQNRFPSIDSAKNYTLRYYRNSTVETFTNLRGQNIAYGTLELLDSLAGAGVIDSIWKTSGGGVDTLKYRISGLTVTVGTFSGGGGSTDSSVFATRYYVGQNFVPYTGAANDVDLGNNSLNAKSLNVTGTAGSGHINLKHQSSNPAATGQSTVIYADANGNLAYKNDGLNRITLNGLNITADRTYSFQNKSYTLADSADVESKLSYHLINGGNNLGSGAQVFKDTSSNKLNFRSIVAGFNQIVTQNTNDITISRDTTVQTLTDASTVTFDASLGVSARVTLTATRTLAFTNFRNGMFLSLAVIQNGTGGWGLNLPAGTKVINGGAGAVTLTTAANSHDILTFWKAGDVIYCNYGKNYN